MTNRKVVEQQVEAENENNFERLQSETDANKSKTDHINSLFKLLCSRIFNQNTLVQVSIENISK